MGIRNRIEQQDAVVLHAHPWRETSLIVELFARDHGRLPLVAKGARRPGSALRGVLMAFQPLLVDWSGGGEVRTLVRAEWKGGLPLLSGRALLCGYYLNELLVRLMARDDPHPRLFDQYMAALGALSGGMPLDRTLRSFEFSLLRELGHLPDLARRADAAEPVAADGRYVLIIEHGLVEAAQRHPGPILSGRCLLEMQAGRFPDGETLLQAKQLARQLIGHHLGGQELQSRRVFTEFQEL